MRIALISYEFPPHTLGGIGTYARHTVEMLVQRGHDVTVFSAAAPEVALAETTSARVHRMPCKERTRFHAVAVPALAAEHARRPFDVAEAPDLFAESLGLRDAVPDLPVVLRAHTPYYIAAKVDFEALPPLSRKLSAARRLFGGLLHRRPWAETWGEARGRAKFAALYDRAKDCDYQAAVQATLIAAPSRALARRLVEDWTLPAERVRVVPYVHLPAAALLALPVPGKVRTIGFHGSVRRFKGVHVLVDAMPKVLARHPNVRFVLAGAPSPSPVPQGTWSAWREDRMVEWRDTLKWLKPKLDALGDRVQLRGFVAPDRLPEHLASCDLCVFPSLFDNFPSACLEAMSAARPIVATRSGGMEDMLEPTDAGLLVAPGSSDELASGICALITADDRRTAMAGRARARVLEKYGPASIGPKVEEVYREAISRQPKLAGCSAR